MYWNEPLEYLITLKDGGVVDMDVTEDQNSTCRTCDFVSIYVTEILFKFSNDTEALIEFESIHESPATQATLMKMLLANLEHFQQLTIDEFIAEMNRVSQGDSPEGREFYNYILP